jgi:aspartyl-tRNA(Asn)/glutamyl-tRNA(Gln) amidotransferase subunit A
VADARAVLDLTRGFDPRDPQSAYPTPDRDAASASDAAMPRVGVITHPFGIIPQTGVSGVLDTAYSKLRAAGVAELVDAELPAPVPREVFEAMWVTGRGLGFADLIRGQGEIMDPGLVRLLGLAEQYSLADYYTAVDTRRAFSAAVFALFAGVDLLVMPTMPVTAFDAAAEVPPGGEADAKLPWITWTPYTYPFNITGQPAISIPCGFAPDGMPVGLQVVGPWGHDERVLAFAARCERALNLDATERVAPVASARTCLKSPRWAWSQP